MKPGMPKVGDVIRWAAGTKSLVVGETVGGLLLVDLDQPVEVSNYAMACSAKNKPWATMTLAEALKGD